MNNQKLNSFGLLAIFLVIAIPTVYGAVEPSIIINMESGQTEKPIQVKNSGGTTVFSVDVDGIVFPSQGSFGSEIVIIDNSANTGGSVTSTEDALLEEITLPTTANQYKITAVEVKVATTSGLGDRICVALLDLVDDSDYPMSVGGFDTMVILAGMHMNPYVSGTHDVLPNTVYKIPITPVILEGGDTFIVAYEDCDSSNHLTFESATSGTATKNLFIERLAISEVTNFDNLRTGSTLDNEATLGGFPTYLKVYGEPLQ